MIVKKSDKQTLSLQLRTPNLIKEGKYLMRAGKDDIKELIKPFANLLKGYFVETLPGSNTQIAMMLNQISHSVFLNKLNKNELGTIYFSFSNNLENLIELINTDPQLKKIWEKILTTPEIKSTDIEILLNRKMKIIYGSITDYMQFPELLFFPLTIIGYSRFYSSYYWNDNDFFIFSIDANTREILLKGIFGENAVEPVIVENLPDDKGLIIENFEPYLPIDLSFLAGVMISDNPTGNLTPGRIKNLKKSFTSPEFSGEVGEWPLQRFDLMINPFSLFYKYLDDIKEKRDVINVGKFAKFLLTEYPYDIKGTKFSLFLPSFKGFTKNWSEYSNAKHVTDIVTQLLQGAEKGWLSMANFRLRYLSIIPSKSSKRSTYLPLFNSNERNRHTLKRKNEEISYYDRYSRNINWFDEIDFPFVVHWIKFLCANGLIEMAVEKREGETSYDDLENIKYVRLTPLGRYAFGFDKNYTQPKTLKKEELDVDDANGIITVLTDNCPYTLFLKQISVAIGNKRFRITPQSLIKNCDSDENVRMRIDNLKSILDIDEYPGLKEVIGETERRMNCAEKVQGDWVVFKLKTDMPGLVKIITTDKEIRENVILGENGSIIFRRSFLSHLKKICSDNGYIII